MVKTINNYIVIYIAIGLFFSGCQFIEVNIVQRSLMEEGQGIETSSVESRVLEEESKLELIVPIK